MNQNLKPESLMHGPARQIVSPNNKAVLWSIPDATSADVVQSVANARRAFDQWSRLPAADRAGIMHEAATRIRGDADALARLMSVEMGKPISQARSEARNVAELIDFFAEEGLRVTGDIPKLDLVNELPIVVKEPMGVVAAITPFNYPLALLTWKLGPALITGCTVVAKPDEHAPSAAIRLAEVFVAAGLPEHVFQVITGAGDVGSALVESPGVDKVAFTGGVDTGWKVAAAAMSHGKRVTLELGGQCPAVVAHGTDLDRAIPPLVQHTFNNSGQYCYRINRIYVDRLIRQEFVKRFVEATERLTVGDSLSESSDIGPLCHAGILDRNTRHIADAVDHGGTIVTGGGRITSGSDGWFMAPTVIDNCTQEMLVMREETFGPVVGIMESRSLGESIQLANDTKYGLAAYVFAPETGQGLQAALRIKAGSVWVNGVKKAYPQLPFGGYKSSGLGREKSRYGLDEYLELKSVYLQLPSI